MELNNVKLYRMTHIENIPHILQYGITHKDSQNTNTNFVAIGDRSLIDTRNNKVVRVDNGDFLNFGAPEIILGEFIPFYFGMKMPMLYVIQNGGNFVEKATAPKDIVYLVCSANGIIHSGIEYYFSDGHATDRYTTFYDQAFSSNLPSIVDWTAVGAPYWSGQENLNIKRKKQAEFLVKEDIPVPHLLGTVCYNNLAKEKLMAMGLDENKIRVVPAAYY